MDIQTLAVKRNYSLTVEQVAQLAKAYISSQQAVATIGGATYLRVLLAGTIHELGATPRQRAKGGPMGKLSDEDITKHSKALESVHAQYYAAILEVCIDEECKDSPRLHKEERARRSLERNRRTNFARSAKSTISSYIKAGFDLTSLAIPSVTKRSIYDVVAATKPKVTPKPETAIKALEAISVKVQSAVSEMIEIDPEKARQEIERLLGSLTSLLVQSGATPTDKPAEAMNRCVPLSTKVGMFWPAGVETRQ